MWQQHNNDRTHCASAFTAKCLSLTSFSHSGLGHGHIHLEVLIMMGSDLPAFTLTRSLLTWKDIYLIILTYIDPHGLGKQPCWLGMTSKHSNVACREFFPYHSRSLYCTACAVINLEFWVLHTANAAECRERIDAWLCSHCSSKIVGKAGLSSFGYFDKTKFVRNSLICLFICFTVSCNTSPCLAH